MATPDPRKDFPLLAKLAYLDNAATTQKPQAVIDREVEYYKKQNANVHRGIYKLAEESTKVYEDARHTVAKFLGAKDEEVVFTSGTTAAMNLAARILEETVQPGDEILCTVAEHHSTFIPFQQLALRRKANFVVAPLANGTITEQHINSYVTKKTKIIAIMQTSNVLGYFLDISKIKKQNAILVVDAAQSIVHQEIKLGNADFIAFSGHKAYGPMGIGCLVAKKKLIQNAEPLFYGGSMIQKVSLQTSTWAELPSRFEAGTPNVAGAAGLASALKYYDEHRKYAAKREAELTDKALAIISKYATVYGPKQRGPIISFTVKGVHAHDVAQVLDSFGVCVRAGHHCCEPLHDTLGIPASVRVSLAFYNNEEDLDKLEQGLKQVQKVFG